MDYTLRSYFIYFGLLIFCFLMAWWADKWNNKRYIFWIALALSFFMGFRDKTVGIDTLAYYNLFSSLKTISIANNYSDPGFYKVAYLLMKIKDDPNFPILIYSSISCFLMVYRLWDYRKISSYKYAILRYVSLFYFYSFNCMRQFLAMAIVFYATKFLEERKYYKFLIFVLIASYFHIAALTAVGYIALEKIRWGDMEIKERNIINIMYILAPVAVFYIMNRTSDRVDPYFNTTSSLTNYISFAFKILLFIAFVIINKNDNDIEEHNDLKINLRPFLVYYFIGMVLNGLGFVWAQFERIGYFYYIFAPCYAGIVANNKKYKVLFRVLLLFIIFRAFYLNCIINSMGQMPFMFNWE